MNESNFDIPSAFRTGNVPGGGSGSIGGGSGSGGGGGGEGGGGGINYGIPPRERTTLAFEPNAGVYTAASHVADPSASVAAGSPLVQTVNGRKSSAI